VKPFKNARPRSLAAAAVSAGFLVPLGVFGAPALAKSAASASQYQYSGSSQYQYKVVLCHHTHSRKHPWVQIRVSVNALKGHRRHHDELGPCPRHEGEAKHGHDSSTKKKHGDDDSTTTTTTTTTAGSQTGSDHGRGDDHGHGNGNGGGEHGRGHGK
jgi:hypothetical protein